MNNLKLYVILGIVIAISSFIVSLLFKISSLKDDLIEMEKLKNKQEIAYFALKNSYASLELSCKKQSDELLKLSKEYEEKKEAIDNYQSLKDNDKYNTTILNILNDKNKDSNKCINLSKKILSIGNLNYKDL